MRTFIVLLLSVSAIASAAPQKAAHDPPDVQAWKLYDAAFSDAVAGRDAKAEALLARLRAEHPGTAAAILGAELERFLVSKLTGKLAPMGPAARDLFTRRLESPVPSLTPPPRVPNELVGPEQPTGEARAEVTFWQTLNGIGAGVEACILAKCSSVQSTAAWVLLGGGLGAGLTLWATRNGITPGQALALDAGTAWGFWNAAALTALWSPTDPSSVAGRYLLGQGIGLGAGALAWHVFRFTAGDVSLMDSGGIWTGVVAAMLMGAFAPDEMSHHFFGVTLVASDAGLLGGALLSRVYPMSRGRSIMIDAGGLLGGLFGFGLYAIFAGDAGGSSKGALLSGATGTVVGLAGAAYFSRGWDAPKLPVQVGLAPTRGGAMVLASASL